MSNPAEAEARHDRFATEPDPRDPSDAAEWDATTEAAIDRCEWIRTKGWRDQ